MTDLDKLLNSIDPTPLTESEVDIVDTFKTVKTEEELKAISEQEESLKRVQELIQQGFLYEGPEEDDEGNVRTRLFLKDTNTPLMFLDQLTDVDAKTEEEIIQKDFDKFIKEFDLKFEKFEPYDKHKDQLEELFNKK